jgi:hypothetical protein
VKKFVRDEGMKEITFPERLKLRLRCSVMAKRRDIGTEIRDKHLYADVTSTNT